MRLALTLTLFSRRGERINAGPGTTTEHGMGNWGLIPDGIQNGRTPLTPALPMNLHLVPANTG